MPSLHYDRRTVLLHWLTAALVVCLWAVGQTIDWFPKGNPRSFARSAHITAGVVLALVLVVRLRWRFGGGGLHLPAAGPSGLDRLATIVHGLLYVLLVATVALGIANAWIRGDEIFGLFRIPAFDPGNDDLRESVEDWHGLAANALIVVAGVHAAAGLVHHLLWKDGVLRRMWPGRS